MAVSRKEFEFLFKLRASVGNDFNNTFKNAIKTQQKLRDNLKNINSLQGKINGYNKTSNAISQQSEKLNKLQIEHQKTAQKIKIHQQNAEKLKEKIKETGDTTGELTAQLVKEENEVQKNTEKLKGNESQIKKTTASIEKQKLHLAEISEKLHEAGVNTDNLKAANSKLQKSYERLQKSQKTIQKLNQAKQNIEKKSIHTKTKIAETTGIMATAGAIIYNGPVKKAAEFEEQMATVKAISGASDGNLQKLSEKAKQMGATTKFTAKEAGQAMEYMAMAGWKTKDMLGGIEGVMHLAAASGEDLAQVSDIVTDAMTAFGMSADGTTNGISNATHFADVLAQAASNANTDVGKMGKTFQYIAPVAGSLGYSVEDTATMIGVMADSGIKASQAGTALRSIITRLATDAGATTKSLGALGTLTENLGVKFYDSKGNTRKLGKVINETREAWKNLTKEEQSNYAKKIAGQSGVSGFLALMNAEQKDFDKLTASIKNADGAAKEMAEIKLDNYNGQITLMQSAWDALQVELGQLLLPTLTKIIKKVTNILSITAEFVQQNPKITKTIGKIAAGLLSLRAGMLMLKLATLTNADTMVSLLQKLTGLRIGFLQNTATSISFANKLKIAGIGISNYFKGIGNTLGTISCAIQNVFNNNIILRKTNQLLRSVTKKISVGFIGFSTNMISIIGKTGFNFLNVLLQPFGNIGNVLYKTLSKSAILSPFKILKNTFISVFSTFGTVMAPIGNMMKTALKPLGILFKTILGPLGNVVGKFLPIIAVITTIIVAVQMLRENFDKIRNSIEGIFGKKGLEIFDKIVEKITNVKEIIKSAFSEESIEIARKKIKEIFGKKGVVFFETFIGSFQKIITAIGQFVEFITTHIVPVTKQVFQLITNSILPGILTGIKETVPFVKQTIQIIANFISSIMPVIGNFIAGIMPIIGQVIDLIQNSVFPIISEIFGFITSVVFPCITEMLKKLNVIAITVFSTILPIGQLIISKLWDVIQKVLVKSLSKIQRIVPVVLSIFNSIFNTIGCVIDTTKQVFEGLIKFIQRTFTKNWSTAWKKNVFIFSSIWNNLKNVSVIAINGIIEGMNILKKWIKSSKSSNKTFEFADGMQKIGPALIQMFQMMIEFVNKSIASIKNLVGKIGPSIVKIIAFVRETIFPAIENIRNFVVSAINEIIRTIQTCIIPIASEIFNFITSIMQQTVSFVQSYVLPVVGEISSFIVSVIGEVITFMQTYVLPITHEIFNFITSTIFPVIMQIIQQIGCFITTTLSVIFTVVQTVVPVIWNIIQQILTQILSTLQAVLPSALLVFQSVFNAIGDIIIAAQQTFNGLIQFITGIFTKNWTDAWTGVKNIFSGIWNGIKSICTDVVNGIISTINGVINGLNSLKIPDWIPGIGGKGVSIPTIPQYAKGTKNTPNTFIAGENGPELITNAPGRTVFTAQQTKDILQANNARANTTAKIQKIYMNDAANQTEIRKTSHTNVPEIRNTTGQRNDTIVINNNITIHVDDDELENLEKKLEENNKHLLQLIKRMLEKNDGDGGRAVYA